MATKQKVSKFMQPMKLSKELAAVVGEGPMPRTEVTKNLWAYIKKLNLQDAKNKRNINPDEKLQKIFGGKKAVNMFEWVEHPTEGRIRRVAVPTTWTDSQPTPSRNAPGLGEHSAEILKELGYSDADIATLIAQGVTLTAKTKAGA